MGAKRVFESEERAIFLEDDNYPEITFFQYADEMLERYEDNERVLWVCGTNYLPEYHNEHNDSYFFTQHLLPCGWASWRDKYLKNYNGELNNLFDYKDAFFKTYNTKALAEQQWASILNEYNRKEQGKKFFSWDYQMLFSIRSQNLLGIAPCVNQIRNIGADNDSTHGGTSLRMIMTRRFCEIPTKPMEFPLRHPSTIEEDKVFDKKTGKIILYMQSQREGYLDGMKGLACLFILLGHFTGIYKYAENASQIDSWFVRILTEGPVPIFTAESFWLYLFFVISGYLLIISTPPRKTRDFLVKCAKRILRLAIPIWGTAIFIFVIQNTISFYNHSVQAIVQNTWLTHLYGSRLTVLDILKEPFFVLILGTSKFNSPFWCLRDMLISSFLIYGVGWICKSKKTETIAVCVLTVLAAITGRSIIMACLCGSCARLLREKAEIQNKKNIMVLAGLLLPLVAFWSGNPVFTSTAFASFLIAVPQVERVKSIFECKLVKRLGAVSFGIYALHWPIINSIGLRIIVMSTNKMRADMMMI